MTPIAMKSARYTITATKSGWWKPFGACAKTTARMASCAIGSCALYGLFAVSCVPVVAASPARDGAHSQPAAVPFNLEDIDRSAAVASKNSLKIILRPERSGSTGLRVRIEVWNLSERVVRVPRITPLKYYLWFRDRRGGRVRAILRPYDLPLREPASLDISELTRLHPNNSLCAEYWLPTFYRRVDRSAHIECRIEADEGYVVDAARSLMDVFHLKSDWTPVPSSRG